MRGEGRGERRARRAILIGQGAGADWTLIPTLRLKAGAGPKVMVPLPSARSLSDISLNVRSGKLLVFLFQREVKISMRWLVTA